MDEKVIAEINAFSEKMHELIQKVHTMHEKYPEPPSRHSSEELKELCVYTRDDKYIREGLRVVIGYNRDIPNQLALRAFVIDKEGHGEWYMNVFRGFLGDIEEYLKNEDEYPFIRGYLSTLRERMLSAD